MLLNLLLTLATARSRFGAHQGGRSVGANKKVRHHVNPLKRSHQSLLALPPDWPAALFADASLPLHVDIGSARGVFCLDAADAAPHTNFLGLEIRPQLAAAAAADAAAHGLRNANFLACNANVNFERLLLLCAPRRPLASVSIQFPDPWSKARHKKRRVVQPALVAAIGRQLPEGGWLFTQTDVRELAEDMRDVIAGCEEARCLVDMAAGADEWDAAKPPMLQGLATERERSCAELERPVYRRCYFKRAAS